MGCCRAFSVLRESVSEARPPAGPQGRSSGLQGPWETCLPFWRPRTKYRLGEWALRPLGASADSSVMAEVGSLCYRLSSSRRLIQGGEPASWALRRPLCGLWPWVPFHPVELGEAPGPGLSTTFSLRGAPGCPRTQCVRGMVGLLPHFGTNRIRSAIFEVTPMRQK